MRVAAFWARIVLLLVFSLLPAFHPGVVLAFDSSSLWLGFALVPFACSLGVFGDRLPRVAGLPGAAWATFLLAIATFAIDGFSPEAARSLAIGAFECALSFLAFRRGWYRLLYVEPIAFLFLAWRLSEFSRSSSAMAEISRLPTVGIACAAIAVWLCYALVVFLLDCAVGVDGTKKKTAALASLAVAAAVAVFSLVALAVPERVIDYVQQRNSVDHRVPPKRGAGSTQSESAKAKGGKIRVDSDDAWQGLRASSSGDGSQRMVMIVESPVDSLYLADEYRGLLDPVRGFEGDPAYFANALARSPYLETWVNPEPDPDEDRVPVKIEVYSAIPDKFTSWLPEEIEPTVRTARDFPLEYSYRATSLVSVEGLTGQFPPLRDLTDEEREYARPYLAAKLSPSDEAKFRAYLSSVVSASDSLTARIEKILKSFQDCQYWVEGEDDTSVAAIARFLFETKAGDCTEFSNAAALLGRLAGIPSRVVTGYAVRRELQTPLHRQALERIAERFPPLENKNIDRLFLVTTAHAHSWPEFYLPGLGWVDFESTQYAIPPEMGGDPNAGDIVIPEFSGAGRDPSRVPPFRFPWKRVLTIAFAAFALWVLGLWLARVATLFALSRIARRSDERGSKARFRLFLARLPARGFRRKRADETPRDFARAFPEIEPMMSLYETSVLHPNPARRTEAKRDLDAATRDFLSRTATLRSVIREFFSLYTGVSR